MDHPFLRNTLKPRADSKQRLPSNPINGRRLPVVGSSPREAAGADSGAGAGVATAIKIGSLAGGVGGGGRTCGSRLIVSGVTSDEEIPVTGVIDLTSENDSASRVQGKAVK